jgi:hypothetical protein
MAPEQDVILTPTKTKRHTSLDSAMTSARRMAARTRQTFVVLELVGGAEPAVQTTDLHVTEPE